MKKSAKSRKLDTAPTSVDAKDSRFLYYKWNALPIETWDERMRPPFDWQNHFVKGAAELDKEIQMPLRDPTTDDPEAAKTRINKTLLLTREEIRKIADLAEDCSEGVEALATIASWAIEAIGNLHSTAISPVAYFHTDWPIMVSLKDTERKDESVIRNSLRRINLGSGVFWKEPREQAIMTSHATAIIHFLNAFRIAFRSSNLPESAPDWAKRAQQLGNESSLNPSREWLDICREVFLYQFERPEDCEEFSHIAAAENYPPDRRSRIVDALKDCLENQLTKVCPTKTADLVDDAIRYVNDRVTPNSFDFPCPQREDSAAETPAKATALQSEQQELFNELSKLEINKGKGHFEFSRSLKDSVVPPRYSPAENAISKLRPLYNRNLKGWTNAVMKVIKERVDDSNGRLPEFVKDLNKSAREDVSEFLKRMEIEVTKRLNQLIE